MNTDIKNTPILFDLYGVLLMTQNDTAMRTIEDIVGGDSSIWPVFWSLRGDLDGGWITDEEFWLAFQEKTGLHDFSIPEVIEADYSGWAEPNPATIALVNELIDAGAIVGLLSNIPATLARRILPQQEWLRRFHSVTLSCDIKYEKPRPEAFRLACQALGSPVEETYFFDDNADNVAAARALGMKAYQFTGVDSVRKALGIA